LLRHRDTGRNQEQDEKESSHGLTRL
jgi:hypothetical protein